MTPGNVHDGERALFSAVLTPHRSLDRRGFVIVMGLVTGISFVAGVVFLAIGAWPVFGFFGLDVVLIWWAFKANYRSARAFEQIVVTPTRLQLRKVSPRGVVTEWTLNPLWVRLDRETLEEFGLQRIHLVSHGRRLPVGSFLAPNERESFAAALAQALREARHGPVRAVVG